MKLTKQQIISRILPILGAILIIVGIVSEVRAYYDERARQEYLMTTLIERNVDGYLSEIDFMLVIALNPDVACDMISAYQMKYPASSVTMGGGEAIRMHCPKE